MKKHIVLTKLFEFGGSNSHLKTLIKYFGRENTLLILEEKNQLPYLKNIEGADGIKIKINSKLHQFAHLRYRFTTNVKELFQIIRSITAIQILSIKYGFADVTVCATDPEKYLYLLWMPFSKVIYILHSQPGRKFTSFTSSTCNITLGKRKKIITVSNSNKDFICTNWEISDKKKPFVHTVYNCIIEDEFEGDNKVRAVGRIDNGQYITTFGHVVAYKNPALWLEVAKLVTARYEHVHFAWVGNGSLWENFKALTKETDRIYFIGAVADPVKYLKEAIIYYQPSLNETHGIAVIEAMSNNLPCVVSNVGGLPESVEDQYNGFLVPPLNIAEHVNAIVRLLDNSGLRKEYGLNAYNKYKKSFSFESFKAKMDSIYI